MHYKRLPLYSLSILVMCTSHTLHKRTVTQLSSLTGEKVLFLIPSLCKNSLLGLALRRNHCSCCGEVRIAVIRSMRGQARTVNVRINDALTKPLFSMPHQKKEAGSPNMGLKEKTQHSCVHK